MSHATVTTAKAVRTAKVATPVTKTVATKAPVTKAPVKAPTTDKSAALKVRLNTVVSKKAPNDLHKQYAAWIKAQTGFEADLKTVQVLLASYHDFQASPEKQAALHNAKQAQVKAAEAKIAADKARVLAQAKKLGLTL